jgi:Protein of unknown function (DUF295)
MHGYMAILRKSSSKYDEYCIVFNCLFQELYLASSLDRFSISFGAMEAAKAQALERNKDWSSLPSEVLNLIAKQIREISDFVRFRAVCAAWRFSTPATDLPPQFPWIHEYQASRGEPDLRFYSMSFDKFYTIHSSKSSDQWLSELSQGYFLAKLYDFSRSITHLCLLNPLINDEIPIPSCKYYPSWFWHRQNQIGEYGVYCALPYPNFSPKLAFCHLGQDRWCDLKFECNLRKASHFVLKDMLFTVDRDTGVTTATDITTGALAFVVPPVQRHLRRGCFHFLEAFGDILAVFGHYNGPSDLFYHEVHRLDVNESTGSLYWSEIKNIGDHALFIDLNGAFILKANDLAGIKANCIYFFKRTFVSRGRMLYKMVRINIETGAKEHRQCPIIFRSQVGWFVPNLCHLQAK